jgi:uncharacterized protein YdaT
MVNIVWLIFTIHNDYDMIERNTHMSEEIVSKAMDEIKNANEDELKKLIEDWFEQTRTAGMKIGAQLISAAVYGAIEQNLTKGSQSSLRDYQRAIKRIKEIVAVQLKQQNNSVDIVEEEVNDGTAEQNSSTNS